MLIIPAILTDDLKELSELEKKAEGIVNRIQIDVIDHKFADNLTIDPQVLRNIKTNLSLDFHLMVKDPIEWISHCLRSEAAAQDRIIGQVEFMQNQEEFIEKVTQSKCLSGLAIDLDTPVEKLNQNVLPKVDVILIMSVPAGFAGQEFNLSVWNKIEKVVKMRNLLDLKFKICIDGGVTKELVHQMESLGVDEVAVGKRIFYPDLKQNLELFNG